MGARIGATIILTALATPALADGVLPVDGVFGNPAGCHLYATGEMLGEDWMVLTADTFSSKKIGCDFNTLAASNAVLFTVDAVCSPGGKRQVTIGVSGQDGLTVRLDDQTFVGPLPPCGPADIYGGSEVSL